MKGRLSRPRTEVESQPRAVSMRGERKSKMNKREKVDEILTIMAVDDFYRRVGSVLTPMTSSGELSSVLTPTCY